LDNTFGTWKTDRTDASYFITTVKSQYFPYQWLKASFELPIATVKNSGVRKSGLSDLLLELSASPLWWKSGKGMIWFGSQLEIPTGKESDGLGSGHAEALPFLAVHHTIGRVVGYAQTGARVSFGSGSHHDDTEADHDGTVDEKHFESEETIGGSLFDPHADQEVVFRSGALYPISKDLNGEVSLSGQTIVASSERGETSLSIIPQFNYFISENLELNVRGEIPLGLNQRFDWRGGVGISYIF
jgi:hypothetical protein